MAANSACQGKDTNTRDGPHGPTSSRLAASLLGVVEYAAVEVKSRSSFFLRALDELLLYSGQYALFYILMNFSASGLGYFRNLGHTVLLAILLLQTTTLVVWGSKPLPRFLLSLLAPAMYTILEAREGMSFVLNMGHMFFWVFSALTGGMQAASLAAQNRRVREVLEFCITAANVSIFIVVYFYFDIRLSVEQRVAGGEISAANADRLVEIGRFLPALTEGVRFRRCTCLPDSRRDLPNAESFDGAGAYPETEGENIGVVRPVRGSSFS